MESFEEKNLLNRTVPGAVFQAGLVRVIGDFYHYRLVDGAQPEQSATYQIIAVAGNELVMERM
ncbi:hypothetical protein PT274_04465 [Leuconostocaceae bacterium ESL0958]|nr:hypothetical protein [Leuconostocaceae bacterium ESL0958]